MEQQGLTEAEAAERAAKGLVNTAPEKITKTNFQILRDNVLTLFNLFNLLIGIALFSVGAYINLAYLAVIALNIAIGIIQEVHARSLVMKLSLLTAGEARVLRDGRERSIPVTEIVLGDTVLLSAGAQIAADAVLCRNLNKSKHVIEGELAEILAECDHEDTAIITSTITALTATLKNYSFKLK